jgi:hypothetical protein
LRQELALAAGDLDPPGIRLLRPCAVDERFEQPRDIVLGDAEAAIGKGDQPHPSSNSRSRCEPLTHAWLSGNGLTAGGCESSSPALVIESKRLRLSNTGHRRCRERGRGLGQASVLDTRSPLV